MKKEREEKRRVWERKRSKGRQSFSNKKKANKKNNKEREKQLEMELLTTYIK